MIKRCGCMIFTRNILTGESNIRENEQMKNLMRSVRGCKKMMRKSRLEKHISSKHKVPIDIKEDDINEEVNNLINEERDHKRDQRDHERDHKRDQHHERDHKRDHETDHQ